MMTPSRIRSAAGAASYYGKDDYYVTGEAGAPGIVWAGQGAAALGLYGQARASDFQSILAGRNPDADGPALSAAPGKATHHPGWDFTFTVPKSVSLAVVAAERHDPALAERLQAHILAASGAMMRYLEENHAFTRVRGADGAVREVQTGNLVYASVLHRSTRGGDPHLHVHNPTANTTRNPETGVWGALETKHAYRWQQVASLVGARDLQARLMAEGFDLERQGQLKWEIAGVDPRLLATFSRRSAEIEEAAGVLAASRRVERLTPAQRDMVQKQTRKAKGPVERDRLTKDWEDRAAALDPEGLGEVLRRGAGPGRDVTTTLHGAMSAPLQALNRRLRDLLGANRQIDVFGARNGQDPDPDARRLATFGVKVLEESSAVFSRHAVMLQALRAAPAGFAYGRLEAAVDRLRREGALTDADRTMPAGLTTQRMLEVEAAVVAAVESGRGRAQPILSEAQLLRALAGAQQGSALNEGQRTAVAGFFTSRDRIRAVPGFAGVGKTFAFATVADIAARHGQRLHGLSTVNSHVQELRRGANIPAQTIASWLQAVEPVMQAGGDRAERARRQWRGTHLIVDEASTLTNESAFRVLRAVEGLGVATVTIAGDPRQTGGPGAGNMFKALLDRGIEQFPLEQILRQRYAPPAFREGVRDLAEGRLQAGMAKLAPHVHAVGEGATDMEIALRAVALWSERRAAGLETTLITATNAMRGLQSSLARDSLRREGQLRGPDETRERLSARRLSRAEMVQASSYDLGDIVIQESGFAGRGPALSERGVVVGIDLENNLLKVARGRGVRALIDLNREHAGGRPRFSVYTGGTHTVAAGERLTWEARFRDRGYERGAEFRVLRMGQKAWTIQHADGRTEVLAATDPALSFTSYAYAMTTERAQGRTIAAPIATMTSREGQAVAETKNYVNWSRLTQTADLVTDDAARVLRMLAQNDGQKPVALDHVRTLWAERGTGADGIGARATATDPGATREIGGDKSDPTLTRGMSR